MALTLVVLVAALAPGCSETSSPRDIGADDADAIRNAAVAASISLTLDSSKVAVGSTAKATVVVKNYRGAVISRPIQWSLSDTSLARMADGARVVTKRAGQEYVRASADGVTGQASLAIGIVGDASSTTPVVANVAVTMDSTKLTVPHTAQASATLRDSNGNVLTGSVTWSSSNTSIATVSSTGVVTAVAAGSATIVATSGSVNGTAPITINAAAVVPVITSISVALDSTKLTVPHTAQATATVRDQNGNVMSGSVTWTSSNTSVVSVSNTGVVTAVSAGSASIVANNGTVNGMASITVTAATVAPVVTTVSVALDSAKLTVPHTGHATATIRDQNGNVMAGSVTWSSSNTSVATVSSAGVVTAVSAGTASIVGTSGSINGSASITILAAAPVLASVAVTLDSTQLTVPHTSQAKATLKDAVGNIIGGSVTWSSSNTSIATVASTGVVTAVAPGTAQITGTSGAITGNASITVVGAVVPVASVTVTLTASSINIGGSTQATAVTKDASGNVLTGRAVAWSSSNTAVANVNASTGAVTGVASGNAAITATSNGKTGSATITVAAAPPSGGGTGSSQIKGTIADLSGQAMSGGKVDALSGSTVVKTVAVSATGTYQIDSLPAGTYDLRLQPSLAYSMGPAEPPVRTVSIATGGSATQSFTVQSALYADNFQSYTSSSQLQSSAAGPGQFWYHNGDPAYQVTGNMGVSSISLDGAAPGGVGKAVMYSFAQHTTANSVNLAGRIAPFNPPGGTTTIAYRWTDYLSPNFENGGNGAVGSSREYKYFLVQLGAPQGQNGMPQIGIYIEGGPDPIAHSITMDVTDRTNSINTTHSVRYGLPATWRGSWNTWVVVATGLGSSNATFTLYLNGTAIINLSGPFLPTRGSIGSGGDMLFPMLGEQLNNGPDQAQTRWFREFGLYFTRPALR